LFSSSNSNISSFYLRTYKLEIALRAKLWSAKGNNNKENMAKKLLDTPPIYPAKSRMFHTFLVILCVTGLKLI